MASLTDDAFLVALAALVQWLPPLLFALYAGAISDRLDRRMIVVSVDLLRAAVLFVVAASIVTGTVSIAIVLVALFVIATAEVFADNASHTLLPMLVRRDDLALANARIQAGFVTSTSSPARRSARPCSPPAWRWPFIGQALLVAAGALLVSRIALPPHRRDPELGRPRSATRSRRASAGSGTTPRCAPWC